MKVLIAAGGGGHFAAACAFMQEAPKTWDISIVGRKYGFEGDAAVSLEYEVAIKNHFQFFDLTTGRLQRKFTKHTIPSLLKIPQGFLQARAILHKVKPDVVVSFGGYVAVPIVIVSFMNHIPVVIHEQIQEAGLANRISSYFAQIICVSWESSIRFFPKGKTVMTGNPIRKEIMHPSVQSP